MRNEQLILPIATLIELTGILTLITNESFAGPIDLGFSVPVVASANIQGLGLIIAGSVMSLFALILINR